MIDLSDWKKEIEDLSRGESIRVNHDECPAGADNRRRLYLTKPAGSPNVVLGYCHNCQDKGVLSIMTGSGNYRQFDAPPDSVDLLPNNGEFSAPKNLVTDTTEWPTEAIAWRIRANLDSDVCEGLGIAYDPSSHRVYLPMWDTLPVPAPQLEGYQLRRLTDRGPKYLTAVKNSDRQPSTLLLPDEEAVTHSRQVKMGVLVEDLISGAAIANACRNTPCKVEVIVNYGTKVTPEVLARCTEYDKGLVWLDNDSEHVCDQAHKIARVWRMISGSYVAVEPQAKDPKNLSDLEIYDIINGHANG